MDLFNPPINYDLTTMSEKIKLEFQEAYPDYDDKYFNQKTNFPYI